MLVVKGHSSRAGHFAIGANVHFPPRADISTFPHMSQAHLVR
jgi:hypothetical protein